MIDTLKRHEFLQAETQRFATYVFGAEVLKVDTPQGRIGVMFKFDFPTRTDIVGVFAGDDMGEILSGKCEPVDVSVETKAAILKAFNALPEGYYEARLDTRDGIIPLYVREETQPQ